jgi:hypothetical protein
MPAPAAPAAAASPDTATPAAAAPAADADTPATAPPPGSRAAKLERVKAIALEYAARTAGARWTVTTVDVDDEDARVGRAYKNDRAARGAGEQRQVSALFALSEEERAAAQLPFAEPSAAELARPAKPWQPQEYGGPELIGLLTELRVDVAFTCPCKPDKHVRIGSLLTHRKGKTCQRKLGEIEAAQGSMRTAAARMVHPATQAAAVRTGATPALNIPLVAAAKIEGHPKLKPACAASPASATPPPARSATSGAAKRRQRVAKEEKRRLAVDALLAERRERERLEKEEREGALRLADELRALAAPRLVRHRLRRMARRARAMEEKLTVDELLAKADAAEATAATAATESRAVLAASAAKRKGWLDSCAAAKRRALTADGAIEWVGERSWAERDAELRRHAVPLD